MKYNDRIELLYKLSILFQTLDSSSNKRLFLSQGKFYLRYRDKFNIELRKNPTDEEPFSSIEFDVFDFNNDEALYSFASVDNILSICLDQVKKIYDEYKNNGETMSILIYGKDIMNIPEQALTHIQLMINLYNEYTLMEAS